MLFIIGICCVLGTICASYILSNLNIWLLLQPQEWLTILGVGTGSFILSNPKHILIATVKALPKAARHRMAYNKSDYLDLMSFLYIFFRSNNISNLVKLEEHIEAPQSSSLFSNYPILLKHGEALKFFCDSFRTVTLGLTDSVELESIMDNNIAKCKEGKMGISCAVQNLGDALPAIGIIAAVMGVIGALGALNAAPAILGVRLAAALVGTLAGILLAYGIVTPVGFFLEKYHESEIQFLECIKHGILAYIQGAPAVMAIEFCRQNVPSENAITFNELEHTLEQVRRQLSALTY